MSDSLFEFFHHEMICYFEEAGSRDQVYAEMERVGQRVGFCLVEKSTMAESRFREDVEVVKYVCKDMWLLLFKKQADNLKTNHNGVYVIQDNRFRFLSRIGQVPEYKDRCAMYLAFTCGVIKGALTNLGMPCTVSCEVGVIPTCKFQIVVQRPS